MTRYREYEIDEIENQKNDNLLSKSQKKKNLAKEEQLEYENIIS